MSRLPDRLPWPVATAIIIVACPLLGVLSAYLTILMVEFMR